MPRLHGWTQGGEGDEWWYGGSYYAATMGKTSAGIVPDRWIVWLWPRLGEAGSNDPTRPLDESENGGLEFTTEA